MVRGSLPEEGISSPKGSTGYDGRNNNIAEKFRSLDCVVFQINEILWRIQEGTNRSMVEENRPKDVVRERTERTKGTKPSN